MIEAGSLIRSLSGRPAARNFHTFVINEIGLGIVTGAFPVGSILASDAVMMETYGVSRTVLREALKLPFPVRCLQGTADTAVSTETALRLLEHAECSDMRLNLVKDADHRFSDGPCLKLIEEAVEELLHL